MLHDNRSDECFLFVLLLEMREESLIQVSNATPAAVGGTLSACLILLIVVAVLVIRQQFKRFTEKLFVTHTFSIQNKSNLNSNSLSISPFFSFFHSSFISFFLFTLLKCLGFFLSLLLCLSFFFSLKLRSKNKNTTPLDKDVWNSDYLTKVRPLFTLSQRVSDNSPLLIVFNANYIDQSNRDFFAAEGISEALTF